MEMAGRGRGNGSERHWQRCLSVGEVYVVALLGDGEGVVVCSAWGCGWGGENEMAGEKMHSARHLN